MYSPLITAERFRTSLSVSSDESLDPVSALLRLYPVTVLRLAELNISGIRNYLIRRRLEPPEPLIACHDRTLRGGIFAQRGAALIFLDDNDSIQEQRYTVAHETGHFLQDHLYPREDALAKLGSGILPVLDGLRPPTWNERVHALLSSASLSQYAHLMERHPATLHLAPEIAEREADADAFAWEILAPLDALQTRFAWSENRAADLDHLTALLIYEFELPMFAAHHYAAHLAERFAPLPPVWGHLRLG